MKLLGTKQTFFASGRNYGLKDHFCKGAKMYNQSFRLGLLHRNGSDLLLQREMESE